MIPNIYINDINISRFGLTPLKGNMEKLMTPPEYKNLVSNENASIHGSLYIAQPSVRKLAKQEFSLQFYLQADNINDLTQRIQNLDQFLINGKNNTGVNELYVQDIDTTYNLIYQKIDRYTDFNLTGNAVISIKFIEQNPAERQKSTSLPILNSEDDLALQFIDYDGTLLHAYTYDDAKNLTALPPKQPNTATLNSEGWNYSLQEIKNFLNAFPHFHLIVGAQYSVKNNVIRIGYKVDDFYNDPEWKIVCTKPTGETLQNEIIVNWGDGTTENYSRNDTITHNYTSNGEYNIEISLNSNYVTQYGIKITDFYCQNYTAHNITYAEFPATMQVLHFSKHQNGGFYNELCRYIVISKGIEYVGVPTSNTVSGYSLNNTAYALAYLNYTSLVLPNTIKGIGNTAFYTAVKLQKISIPKSVTQIYASSSVGAFAKCYSLLYLNIPYISTAVYQGVDNNFYGELPNLIEHITPSNCIREYYCMTAPLLKRLSMSNDIVTFSNWKSSNALEIVHFSTSLTSFTAAPTGVKLKEIDLSNTHVSSLPTDSFQNAVSCEIIKLPNTLTTINVRVFQRTSAKTIQAPAVTSIGQDSFNDCPNLITLTLPVIETVGSQVFYYTPQLENYRLPNTLTSIGASSFSTIKIQHHIIPDSVTTELSQAVRNQQHISEFTIGSGITKISKMVMNYADRVTKIHIRSTTPPTLTIALTTAFCQSSATSMASRTLCVPRGSLTAYQAATNWAAHTGEWLEE